MIIGYFNQFISVATKSVGYFNRFKLVVTNLNGYFKQSFLQYTGRPVRFSRQISL